jgi:hypothetical protein
MMKIQENVRLAVRFLIFASTRGDPTFFLDKGQVQIEIHEG